MSTHAQTLTDDAVNRLCAHTADHVQQLISTVRALQAELDIERMRFTEHLDAWKANSAWHAERIDALEAQVRQLGGNP